MYIFDLQVHIRGQVVVYCSCDLSDLWSLKVTYVVGDITIIIVKLGS